jgi:hypothetical protein
MESMRYFPTLISLSLSVSLLGQTDLDEILQQLLDCHWAVCSLVK